MTDVERLAAIVDATPAPVRVAAEALAYMDGAHDYRLVDVARLRGIDAVHERLQRAWRELGALQSFGLTVNLQNPQD